jgi:hypothetical protein
MLEVRAFIRPNILSSNGLQFVEQYLLCLFRLQEHEVKSGTWEPGVVILESKRARLRRQRCENGIENQE